VLRSWSWLRLRHVGTIQTGSKFRRNVSCTVQGRPAAARTRLHREGEDGSVGRRRRTGLIWLELIESAASVAPESA
jgi:hypothetical protein